MTTLKEVLETAAAKYGVPQVLAEATAWHESSLDPTAVGDDGTSFGLYQLHEGGELGSLTKQEAFDPATNADTALAEFGDVKRNNPDISGGAWAAAAQRPADPTAYAVAVNGIIAEIDKGNAAINEALAKEVAVTGTPVPAPGSEPVPDPTPAPDPVPSPEPAPSPEVTYQNASLPVLKQTMTGPPVKLLQSLLPGSIAQDSIFGPITESALRYLQSDRHIPVTGETDAATWEMLIGKPLSDNPERPV